MSNWDQLAEINPSRISNWLKARGWENVATQGDKSALFQLASNDEEGGGTYEVELPLNSTLLDYPRRVRELFATLEIVESRPAAELLAEVNRVGCDSIQLRWVGGSMTDGRVPVDAGAQFLQSARDLLVAGACSSIKPRRAHTKRKPDVAIQFARKARLAPLKAGSFVVAIEIPLPPILEPHLFEPELPFERQASSLISTGVQAASRASSLAVTSSSLQAFQDSVGLGVSANLCEALASMLPDFVSIDHFEVSFSWSSNLASIDEVRHEPVRFSQSEGEILTEAARLLKSLDPEPDFTLQGLVVMLSSEDPSETGGEVKILGQVNDAFRRVSVHLPKDDYVLASGAHLNNSPVVVEGELEQKGHTFTLRNARRFEVLED